MKIIYVILALFLFDSSLNAQERKDGYVVVNLSKSVPLDVKCDVYKGETPESMINELINKGRYILSIADTNYGTLILHEKNKDSIEQLFYSVPLYMIKNKMKEMFKRGYTISCYIKHRELAFFEKNSKIKEQKILNHYNNKIIEKYNKQGFYLKIIDDSDAILQKGHENVILQMYKHFSGPNSEEEMLNDFIEYRNRGWRIGSIYSNYFSSSNQNSYHIIYDKYANEDDSPKEIMGIVKSIDDFSQFISNNSNSGYYLSNIWSGLHKAKERPRYSYSEDNTNNLFDILGGIVGGVSKLANGNVTDTSAQNSSVSESEGSSNTSSYNSSSSSSSRVSNTSKVNHANWKSLDNSYNGYENQLIRMHSSGSYNKQEVRTIQSKMKDIRRKIYEQSGHQRAVSQWENWNP